MGVLSGEEMEGDKLVNMSSGGQCRIKVRSQRMPRVLEELVREGSVTGWHLSRDLQEGWEWGLHLHECPRLKEAGTHSPTQECPQPSRGTGQRGQGRGSKRSVVGDEASEVAGWSHRALQARIRSLQFILSDRGRHWWVLNQ